MLENDNKNTKDYDAVLSTVVASMMASEREQHGKSQEEVSYLLGIKYCRYYAYEKAKRRVSLGTLKEFCRVLNIDYTAFVLTAIGRAEALSKVA